MKLIRKFSILAAMACVAVVAFAQGDAKKALQDIQSHRTAKLNELRQSGKALTDEIFNSINSEVKQKALEALKDVDPMKVEAKDAYDWAQIYAIAERHHEACELIKKFLTSNPTPQQRYSAQMLMLQSCNAMGEADMLAMTLMDVEPTNGMTSSSLARSAVVYARTIAAKKGVNEAIKTLEDVEKKMIYEDPQAIADRNFAAQKRSMESRNNGTPLTAEQEETLKKQLLTSANGQNDNTKFGFAQAKAEMLIEANRKDEAVRVLDSFLATVPADSPVKRSASMSKTRITLPGSVAPELNFERGYGGVKSLAELKGKVVIVDMFAHWCGPCIASFPSVRKMYDELKDQGLEIVGVTTYYGYYKTERPLDKDAEYARMADFMKEHNMNWPVVYGDRSNFESYGVSGIPTVFLLDREGKVREIKVGYSPDSFAKFRAQVEELLKK